MINIYRFFVVVLFVSLNVSFAQMCSVESCNSSTNSSCFIKDDSIFYVNSGIDDYANLSVCKSQYPNTAYFDRSTSFCMSSDNRQLGHLSRFEIIYDDKPTNKFFCSIEIDPKPDLSDWENCKIGKDHGFYWVTIGDGNGEGESRFKREWWSCEEPEFWKEYNHPSEDNPKDPDPIDPKDPDPTDPKPGDGGDGTSTGDGGENGNNGNGNNNGNTNGSSEGNGNYDKDDLSCKGLNCSGSNVSKGNVPSFSDSDIYKSESSSKTFNDVFNENFRGIDNTAIGNSLNSFIPVLPVGKCPSFYFEPLNMNLGFMNIDLFDGANADIPCWIWDLIGTFIIIFAVMYSRTIVMGA